MAEKYQVADGWDKPASKDQAYVRFHLPPRYFQSVPCSNGMARVSCLRVLYEAFGVDNDRAADILRRRSGGFDIVCTTKQFGQFIIWRHQLGHCINGVRDLAPKFVGLEEANADQRIQGKNAIAWKTNLPPSTVLQVLDALDTWSVDYDEGFGALNVVTDR